MKISLIVPFLSILASVAVELRQNDPSKHITSFTAQLVTFETTVPVTQVLARLDTQLNKTGSGLAVVSSIVQTAKTWDEFVSDIDQITGNRDFLYFSEFDHYKYLNIFSGTNSTPITVVYTLGNPVVAQTILQYDLRAGLNIPPRILILEKADHSGTKVQYDLPSSLIVTNNQKLKAAAEALDTKLENLVRNVTSL